MGKETAMDELIASALERARSAVEQADLPETWRVVAFESVLNTLLEPSTPSAASAATVAPPQAATEGLGRLGLTQEAFSDAVAMDTETGSLKLLLPSSRIPTGKSDATHEVAILVVSARVASGLDTDEWVDSQHVRTALDEYGRYDQSNFSAHLRKFEDEMSSLKKDGRLLFKLRRQGWERATQLWTNATAS